MSLSLIGYETGTGGEATNEYLKARGIRGYRNLDYDPTARSPEDASVPTPAENLARVRSVLQPAITDLAKALGVSRQAIYDWQAGKPIAADNATRLVDLARAADVFAREGLTTTAHMLRRPIAFGKNLFEIVRDGGSAEVAARQLVDMVRRELVQRAELDSRRADRERPARDQYDDAGVPMLDERS
jgi:hypothetical protein